MFNPVQLRNVTKTVIKSDILLVLKKVNPPYRLTNMLYTQSSSSSGSNNYYFCLVMLIVSAP